MLRDEIRKSDDITQTKLFKNLDYLKKFDDSFNYAVILLGAFFGFRKFYDNYYEALNLRFYKDFKTPQKQTEKEELQDKIDKNFVNDNSVKTVTEEEKVKEEKAKATNEEKLTETTSVEEQNLLTEEQQTEVIFEKQSDISNTQQDENKEVVSDIKSHYQKIIEQAIRIQFEIKYVDIPKLIKQKTGDNIDKDFAIKITEQMDGVEKVKIGNVKNPNGIRQKGITGPLFNE